NRKRKRKNRPATLLAGYGNRATVGFHDRPGNRQSHSSSLYHSPLILTSIEFVENQSLFECVNSRSLIRHTDHHEVAIRLSTYDDRFFSFGIEICIVQQLYQNFFGAG